MNKLWGNVYVDNINFVHETKYLGVIICLGMKISFDAIRQIRKFYAQANTILRKFRCSTNDVECMLFKLFCANM